MSWKNKIRHSFSNRKLELSEQMPLNSSLSPDIVDSTLDNFTTDSHHMTIAPLKPPRPSPYKEVHVLMFLWEADDLNCIDEACELRNTFQALYGFTTYTLLMPAQKPYEYVEGVFADLKHILDSPENLVIVYYSGHGIMFGYGRMTWRAYGSKKNFCTPVPMVLWSPLQIQLERCAANVLIILDCCEAGGALHVAPPLPPSISSKATSTCKPGITELIAASPFDMVVPGPGEYSFTNALIGELKALSKEGNPYSAAELHKRVLLSIVRQRTSLLSRVIAYPSQSPIYVRLVGEADVQSIMLLPRVLKGSSVGQKGLKTEQLEYNAGDEVTSDQESLIEVPEIQGLKLRQVLPFKVGATSRPRPYYWRTREYEAQKKQRLEDRREKLWTIARTPRRWWDDCFDIECRYYDYSREDLIFAQGITKAIWWRWMEYLRDLSLRAPALEKAADL